MAWTYTDYLSETTAASKRAKLVLHIQEVADALANFKTRAGADGWSYTRYDLQQYLDSLKKELTAHDAVYGSGVPRSGMFVRQRLNNG